MATNCPICLDALRNPVLCPCPGRHTFCRRCLRGLRQFQCPVCRDASDDVVYFMFKKSEPLTDRDHWRAQHMANAAQNGHFQVVWALLKLGCAVDREQDVEPIPRTALQLASFSGKGDIVRLLLEWHASVNKMDLGGLTALHLSASGGHSDIARTLLHAGAYKNKRSHHDETPLSSACFEGHLEVVKLLIAERADVDISTPLHAAASFPHSCEVVRYLVEETHLPPFMLDREGNSVLHIACLDGAIETIAYLFDGSSLAAYLAVLALNWKNKSGCTPLSLACGEHGHLEIVRRLVMGKALVNCCDHRGRSPLAIASSCGHYDVVTYLLVRGSNVHIMDKSGETPLHGASYSGCAQVVRSLLFHQASVDHRCSLDCRPLAHAVGMGHAEVVEVLLRARASANTFVRDESSMLSGDDHLTPLQLAFRYKQSHVVPSLLTHRASVSKTHRLYLDTPLHLACRSHSADIVQALLERKANTRRRGEDGRSPLLCTVVAYQLESTRRLIQAGAPLNQVDIDGMAALHHGVALGFVEMVDILLQAKAAVNKLNGFGHSPLQMAVNARGAPAKRGMASGRARSLAIVRTLLQAKAKMEERSTFGTPLMCAVTRNDVSMVKILVEAGASLSPQSGPPSPLDLARRFEYTRIEKFLDRAAKSNANASESGVRKRRRQM